MSESVAEASPVQVIALSELAVSEGTKMFPGLTAVPRLPEGAAVEALAASALLEDPEVEGAPDAGTVEEIEAGSIVLKEELLPASEVDAVSTGDLEIATPIGSPMPNQTANGTPLSAKQGHLQIGCPNCGCPGTLPWGKLGSLLCCSRCWRWYRIAAGGKLEEAPAPKKFKKGTMRFYQKNGKERLVEVTAADVKRRRRSWKRARFRALGSLNVSDLMVLWMAAGYMTGVFVLCIYLFRR